MSIQTIVATPEPPEQPRLFGPAVTPKRSAPAATAAVRPSGATTYRWRTNPLNKECQTCRGLFEAALEAHVAWAELPHRPAHGRHAKDTRVGNVVMKTEYFCTPHAPAAGYKGRA